MDADKRGDNDGQLNKSDLTIFCLGLKLTEKDADSFSVLAKLGPKKSKVSFDEF